MALLVVTCIFLQAFTMDSATSLNVNQLNQFAINLYQQSSNTSYAYKNMAISPFGISLVLEIIYSATSRVTQAEIGHVLGNEPQNNTPYSLNDLANTFVNSLGSGQFINANALWLQSDIQLKPNFVDQFKDADSGNFYFVDFLHNPDKASDQINDWVKDKTKGFIPQLIDPGMLDDQTKVVITNAIYFKGLWQNAFDKSFTEPDLFTLNNGQQISVPMMSQDTSFDYDENSTWQMISMPYKESSLAMVILLPKNKSDFSKDISSLNNNELMSLIEKATSNEIMLSMPKFILHSAFDDLQQNLQSLGIKQIFSNNADFSPMTDFKPLRVSQVIQKTYVAVDESGTVAAAATGAGMVGAAVVEEHKPLVLKINHPFLFMIYDTQTQLILFIGNVWDPSVE